MSDAPSDGNSTKLPPIKLIIADEREIDNTYAYDNLEVVQEAGNPPEVFNKHLDTAKYCMCLGPYEQIIDSIFVMGEDGSPLEELVSRLHGKGEISGIYCDLEYTDKTYPYYQSYPSWGPGLLNGNVLINSPMLFKPDGVTKYNEELEGLYHFQFILQYGLTNLLRHCPRTHVSVSAQNYNLETEIETIRKCLAQ